MPPPKLPPTVLSERLRAGVPGTPHLVRRKGSTSFYARVRVPPGALIGSHRERSLRTSDLAEAKRRLPHVVAALKADIERTRRDPEGGFRGSRNRTPDDEAAWWRKLLAAAPSAPAEGEMSAADAFTDKLFEMRGEPIGDDHQEVYDPAKEAAAEALADAVHGYELRVGAALDRYLDQSTHTIRYQSRIRLAVTRLTNWLKAERLGDNLTAVDRRTAGLFIDHLSAVSTHSGTANSYISCLCSYWRWMIAKGVFPKETENPWKEQPPAVVKSAKVGKKRPFADAEVVKLLSGETSATLHDIMRVALLSGMRIGEIARLTVADCAGGVFDITATKTDAGERRVPIHPDLAPLMKRRTAGKAAGVYLFDELKAPPSRPRERSAKATERFTAYRRDCGVDARGNGQRQSDVDFHSFRRWFITAAERADQPPHLISAVVGHEAGREGMTLGTYSGGPSDAQRLAVVEAVRLALGAPVDKPGGRRMGDGRQRAAISALA